LGEWLDHWLTISKRSVRPSTFVGYEGYVRNHINPALGHHRLDKLQPEHLEAFYADLADVKRLSPAMQLQQHRVISRALKIAMQRGRVPRNVDTLVAAPTLKRKEVVPFDEVEAGKILSVAASRRNAGRWSVVGGAYQHVMPKVIADATESVGGVLFTPVATTVAPPARS
jgi:integrase